MLKKLLPITLFLCTLLCFSQEMVKEFDLKLEKNRDYFQVTNETDKEVILFLNDKEKVTSVKFDQHFNIIDSLSSARPKDLSTEIIGYSQKDSHYFLFWGSRDRKEITSQYFNFTNKETGLTPINLELKKEKIITEITINNVFYLITIVKNTSILKFYISDDNGNLNEKTADLSNLEFKNIFNNPENLYTVLTDESSEPSFQKIANDSPPSLALSAKYYKIYSYNPNEIIFTIDNTTKATQVLRIDLHDFTSNLKSIPQQKIDKGEYGSRKFKSNSFLIDNKILQLKTNSFVLFLTISDLNGNKINEYKVFHDQEIYFKNSDIFQEANDFFHKKRQIEKSEQFFRKINGSPSVSSYNLNGIYYTVIGSSIDNTYTSGGGMSGNGVMTGIPSGRCYSIENLISYKDKIVVYTNCLFDSNFNHLNDQVQNSAFDKVRIFLEENEDVKEALPIFSTSIYKDLILFKFNSSLYLGNYNKKKKKYQFFGFTE
ncbi:hypothetical protein GKZ90_0019600 [Flavobacterium sp. MC2016-06]|uniref:hypothetical protein n=1 Tax=Flavobacterium sp. MC2016-06 TaxID=2676308 RepID=UPI0012BAC8E2|nr:hypothetical protein [Flavobacterium sp. MC2016-06]MBU3861428.1 hypothetical protein [Flavobacterium sp. MC2016-06]